MQGQSYQCALEALESRQLLSGGPLAITPMPLGNDSQLIISGTAGNDDINVRTDPNGLLISNGGWSMTVPGKYQRLVIHGNQGNDTIAIDPAITIDCAIYGDQGNDTLKGGGGDDTLYGGQGADLLDGGRGDNLLVDVGSSGRDTLAGSAADDNFWADSTDQIVGLSTAERSGPAMHQVGKFFNSTTSVRSKNPSGRSVSASGLGFGQKLADPAFTDLRLTYRSFAGHPLFSAGGPSPDDVRQGALGDCYLLGALSAIAKANPRALTDAIVDLGDGTYAVQLVRKDVKYFVRVDDDLPVSPTGALAYADAGKDGSLWVAIFEKAYAIFRRNAASYASLAGGFMDEVNSALGKSSRGGGHFKTGNALLGWMKQELNQHRAVTFGTRAIDGGMPIATLTPGHAYMVDAVLNDRTGQPAKLRLRNPWGGVKGGYLTINAAQALTAYAMAFSAAA